MRKCASSAGPGGLSRCIRPENFRPLNLFFHAEDHMRWIRGAALFLAGIFAGMFFMQTASSQQKPTPGMHLNHFGMYVKDLDASTEFYTKKLGFHKAFTFTDADHMPVVYLQLNRDTFLELSQAGPGRPLGFSHGGIVA